MWTSSGMTQGCPLGQSLLPGCVQIVHDWCEFEFCGVPQGGFCGPILAQQFMSV
jgi:hypothetical protein